MNIEAERLKTREHSACLVTSDFTDCLVSLIKILITGSGDDLTPKVNVYDNTVIYQICTKFGG